MDQAKGVPGDPATAVHVVLWLDGSMPSGVATGPEGAKREFTGWIGLMSAVDALTNRERAGIVGDDDGESALIEPV